MARWENATIVSNAGPAVDLAGAASIAGSGAGLSALEGTALFEVAGSSSLEEGREGVCDESLQHEDRQAA